MTGDYVSCEKLSHVLPQKIVVDRIKNSVIRYKC